jgi:ketosteroid isomerase-like protein
MSSPLPTAVAQYLAAKQNHDSDALLATLTDDAVITDEGRQYRGAAAIRAWHEEASAAVAATYAVTDAAAVGDRTVVAVRVAGDFPGSPVPLYFHIALREDKISAVTVVA